jgi:hypothetical protein
MWQIFGNEIIRFSILVVMSLVIFGLFWLYYDAWKERRIARTAWLLMGLLLLSLSFLMQGLNLETEILISVWPAFVTKIYLYIRAVAYVFVIIGLWLTPIEERPKL